ncbi:MAG: TonB-dependent receptor [Saprospiraceae bacterium]|nr:TonB-dependent receptor [Saprospiraceae bacterium]
MFNNDLHRRQQGKGSTGSDYDLTVSEHRFNRNIHFKTKNVAFFAENLFTILPQLEMSLGARLERGGSNMSGVISYLTPEKVPNSIQYHFPLFGASIKYQVNNTTALYCSGSQAYRPVIFADLIPATVLERSDPDLKNALGYNVDIGIKGKTFSRLTYDVNYFIVQYNNRIGNQVLTDDTGQQYALKTNIGNSVTHGAEILIDVKMAETDDYFISLFMSTSILRGIIRKV